MTLTPDEAAAARGAEERLRAAFGDASTKLRAALAETDAAALALDAAFDQAAAAARTFEERAGRLCRVLGLTALTDEAPVRAVLTRTGQARGINTPSPSVYLRDLLEMIERPLKEDR